MPVRFANPCRTVRFEGRSSGRRGSKLHPYSCNGVLSPDEYSPGDTERLLPRFTNGRDRPVFGLDVALGRVSSKDYSYTIVTQSPSARRDMTRMWCQPSISTERDRLYPGNVRVIRSQPSDSAVPPPDREASPSSLFSKREQPTIPRQSRYPSDQDACPVISRECHPERRRHAFARGEQVL